jgi:hypothetical protein
MTWERPISRFRSGNEPKSRGRGAERQRMDFNIGIKQVVDQEISAKVNAIAAIGLEQDGSRHQQVLEQDASVEPKIGADIDENVGLDCSDAADEILQLAMLGDLGRDFEAADIGRAHQKLGAEIAADEIAAAMDELVIRAVEAAADFVPPARWEKTYAAE